MLSPSGVNNTRQLISAGCGGAVGSLLDVAVLVLLVEHGAPVALAAFSGAAVGAVTNFALNKYLAFRDRSPISRRQLARFGLVAVATALLMAGAMQIVAVGLGVPYLVAKLICAALVFAVWTYPAQRRLVFRRPAYAV
ncbi:MAG TPA: GtrA family protein [Kofleriaceae bacterium]|nr:GtrA family protein [Kofleriaceae bacterium]